MKQLLIITIFLLGTFKVYADSHTLKAEKGIEAKIIENTFGGDGSMIITNTGKETVEVILLKKKPDPETRGPITLEQFMKISLTPGQKRTIQIVDTKGTIYGIGVINNSKGEPYEIHGFKWKP